MLEIVSFLSMNPSYQYPHDSLLRYASARAISNSSPAYRRKIHRKIEFEFSNDFNASLRHALTLSSKSGVSLHSLLSDPESAAGQSQLLLKGALERKPFKSASKGKWLTELHAKVLDEIERLDDDDLPSLLSICRKVSVCHKRLRYWFPETSLRIVQLSEVRMQAFREKNRRWVAEKGMPGLYKGRWPSPDVAIAYARTQLGLSVRLLDIEFESAIGKLPRDQLIHLREIACGHWRKKAPLSIRSWTRRINRLSK